MNVNSRPVQGTGATSPALPLVLNDKKIPQGATVEHNAQTDTFEYSAPGQHYSVSRPNFIKQGLTAAAVVALPALVGAVEHGMFGTLAAGLGGIYTGIIGGVIVGAAVAGYSSFKESKNPVFAVLAGLAGAAAGAVAFPILKQPGLLAGLQGAAIATGVAGLGVGLATAIHNRRATQDAKAHGWKPQGS